jgi:hypothetical protein
VGWALVLAALSGPLPASAQLVSGGEGYAVIVGSNHGGPGQATLRYAEADTQRVHDVLTSLGGYAKDHVLRLLQPTAAELREALARVQREIEPLSRRGVQSRFFFYFSGHARADALNLGPEQVPLSELRQRIVQLPATLSIVVLDACQSGAFSRTKGAEKTADFSFNSVERLNTAGIAVIASSNERELSQESDELRSSYFTHHWLVGLRGAGDDNHDGRVTLSEAYQYAYNHTLANTAETAGGEQHATLETNLKGQDEVPLTQPSAARAKLLVPAQFEGRVLLQALPSWSVLAELDKAKGAPIELALPPGNYAATLRRGKTAARCTLQLQDGRELELRAEQCTLLAPNAVSVKGRAALSPEARRDAELREQQAQQNADERWILELGVGLGIEHLHSSYLRTLHNFGFSDGETVLDDINLRFTVNLGWRLSRHLLVGLSYVNLQERDYQRTSDVAQKFGWAGHSAMAFLQGDVSMGRRRLFTLFSRLGLGASLAWTTFDAIQPGTDLPDPQASLEDTTPHVKQVRLHFVRPCGFISAGLQLAPSRYVGFTLEARWVVAPAIENSFGQYQDLGGVNVGFALLLRSWN